MAKQEGGQGDVIAERTTPTISGMAPAWLVIVLALGSGFVVFVGLGLLAWAFGWPIRVVLAASGAVVVGVWFVWIFEVRGMFWVTETARAIVPKGQGETAPASVQIEVSEPFQKRVRFLELGISQEQLGELAHGLALGRPFSEAEWTGAGRPFARGEFRQVRSVLLERGLLAWRNERAPSQGVGLTKVGEHVFNHIADDARTHAHARDGGPFALPSGRE